MATSLPYSAPYTRTRPQAREVPQLDRRVLTIITCAIAGVLIFAMLQLWLASEVSSTLKQIAILDQQKGELQANYDALRIRSEELQSPGSIETRAIKEKLGPVPVEFAP